MTSTTNATAACRGSRLKIAVACFAASSAGGLVAGATEVLSQQYLDYGFRYLSIHSFTASYYSVTTVLLIIFGGLSFAFALLTDVIPTRKKIVATILVILISILLFDLIASNVFFNWIIAQPWKLRVERIPGLNSEQIREMIDRIQALIAHINNPFRIASLISLTSQGMAFLIAIQCLLLAVVTWAAMKFRAQAPINTENAGKDIWSRRRKFFLTVWSLPFIMLKPIEARLKPIAIGNKPNIILISIDTLRADGLGTYGNPRNTSPWIDSLAADGLVLPNALSQSSWTLPSHASMLTALQPIEHGCRGLESNALPKHIHTLSEHLVNDGYKTYAVVSNILVSGAYGLDQGFDHFVTLPGGTNSDKVVNTVLTELPNKKWTIHISCLCM